ncbi:DUF262 domain-containing protein [Sinimarinibacterium flocculans]|uniref:DUF262 domain-containing protein n=1 Tax=Sinimarinibacterium flocculans TaxID=985250 RepID=UPI003513BA25
MRKNQFEAGTYGIGELITQKKLFRVPRHQRSYAWPKEDVSAFIDDIERAFVDNDADYFIGLVVIQGPEDGEWILLDGQQRLTTTTMLFSAVRNWLTDHGLKDDAKQIEAEFLAVRRLGGDYSSRMQLNEENQNAFRLAVIDEQAPSPVAQQMLGSYPKKSSNYLLIDAAKECRRRVDSLASATGKSERDKADRLFKLSTFLETRVKVVCVEVSSDVDAYILFESLNDRGVELSALDLVKNYAYSRLSTGSSYQFDRQWARLLEQLEDRNPDDFLKVSWTAKHGVVQKSQLFKKIRQQYKTSAEVLIFADQLVKDANNLSAFDDPDHPMWSRFPAIAKERIYVLGLLGGKQVRPVVLSALSNLEDDLVVELLWLLIVVIIRFQIVGRGRTGVMEKTFGSLCEHIASEETKTTASLQSKLQELYLDDEQFAASVAVHDEPRVGRFAYFLAEMELYLRALKGVTHDDSSVQLLLATTTLVRISNPGPQESFGELREPNRIGSFMLVESELSSARSVLHIPQVASQSKMLLSRDIEEVTTPDGIDVHARSASLALLAARVWRFAS